MQKHLTGLAGLFTGFALLSATGAQAQTVDVPTAPDALAAKPLILTPAQGFDRELLKPHFFTQDRVYGPRLDEEQGFKAPPRELRSRFRIEESAGSGFVDRLSSGDIARREIGDGSLSLRLKKGISIRYKLKF